MLPEVSIPLNGKNYDERKRKSSAYIFYKPKSQEGSTRIELKFKSSKWKSSKMRNIFV